MYWVSILLIVALEGGWTLREVIANAFFATGPMHVARMSGVYWTLYIEMLFYATVPLVFLAGRRAIQFSPYVAIGLFGTLWAFGVRSGVAPHYLAYCYLGLQFGAWQRQVISGVLLLISLATVTAAASVLPFHLTVSGYRVAILWSGAARLHYTSLRGYPTTVSGESDRIFWAYFV